MILMDEQHRTEQESSIHPDALALARRIAGLERGTYFIRVTKGRKGIYWELLLPYGDGVESGKES